MASNQQYRTYDPCGRVHQTECIRGIYGIFPGGDPAWRDPGSCCIVLEQAVALLHKKNPEKQPAVPRTVLTFVEKYCDKDKWILWFKILVACLPTIIIALPFNDIIEEKFYNYVVVAIMLIVYGVLFIVIENYNKRRRPTCTRLDELSFKTALIIGCFQVLSVIPGTSRSGSTIIGGILAGTSRTVAAEFTFFLAIPVMFGASLLKLVKFGFAFSSTELIILIVGVVVSFVVSILAIKFLMGYIKKHDFKIFGWYRIILGILVLGYFVGKTFLA